MRAIIVDDELQSHLVLKDLLAKNHPEVEIVATGESVAEGLYLIRKHEPDVVFLDIEMPDGTGFELLEQLEEKDFQVIFITAHNEYAITAIRFEALDYLLKPIIASELKEALRRVKKKLRENISKEQIQNLIDTFSNQGIKKLPTRIAISTSEGILYQQIKDIIRLEAQQSYTRFHIQNHKNILASVNIGEYAEQFKVYREFRRAHRSHLVNLNFVKKFVKSDGGYLVMQDGSTVNVSRHNRDDLLEGLGGL